MSYSVKSNPTIKQNASYGQVINLLAKTEGTEDIRGEFRAEASSS